MRQSRNDGKPEIPPLSSPPTTEDRPPMTTKAEIIAIGTELTSGQKLDTNSQWLSLELAALGIPVHWHSTLADDLDDNVRSLRIAADRADLVLITGGLGPTLDDLTRDALAKLAGVDLVLDQPSLDFIEGFFQRRGRAMPDSQPRPGDVPRRRRAAAQPDRHRPGNLDRAGSSLPGGRRSCGATARRCDPSQIGSAGGSPSHCGFCQPHLSLRRDARGACRNASHVP